MVGISDYRRGSGHSSLSTNRTVDRCTTPAQHIQWSSSLIGTRLEERLCSLLWLLSLVHLLHRLLLLMYRHLLYLNSRSLFRGLRFVLRRGVCLDGLLWIVLDDRLWLLHGRVCRDRFRHRRGNLGGMYHVSIETVWGSFDIESSRM